MRDELCPTSGRAALFTDLYELAMAQAYWHEGLDGTAVFELFFRKLPQRHNYLVAAGLNRTLELLEGLQFDETDLEYLRSQGNFRESFLDELRNFAFEGDVWAVPEGTLVFPQEPLVQVIAPLPQAQLIETLVLNQVHFASLAATKAARTVLAAGGRKVVDFGSRRAHGMDAGLIVARAAYLAGAAGTSLVEAGRLFGVPVFGTMAHSYIQAHQDEYQAFSEFARLYAGTTLLVDTYDTLQGVQKVIALSRELRDQFSVRAVRLDSGDLADLAEQARKLLDDAGLSDVEIFASGGLDEYLLEQYSTRGVPIDGYGVGTAMAVSDDAPSLDMAYKLVEYDGLPRMKLSSKKEIFPGRKQVFRSVSEGQMQGDTLAPADETCDGETLLQPVMRGGRRLPQGRRLLKESRRHARDQLARLPARFKALETSDAPYAVGIHPRLREQLQRLRHELEHVQLAKG